MRTYATKVLALLLILVSLAGCGTEAAEETPMFRVESTFESNQMLAGAMASDHLKANVDYLNTITVAFEESNDNMVAITLYPSNADNVEKVLKDLPEGLGNAIREYASTAEFYEDDYVNIELYNMKFWREHDEEARNRLRYPETRAFVNERYRMNTIIRLLDSDFASNVYGEISIVRYYTYKGEPRFSLILEYFENTDDIPEDDSIDGHWTSKGFYDVMSGM